MVLNYKSNENGLDITYISYHMYILDTCVQYTVKISYKNISSIPISLKFENDLRDLGLLCYLESYKEGDLGGVFKGGAKVYPLIQQYDNDNDNDSIVKVLEELNTGSSNSIITDFETQLLPNQTIHLTSKYLLNHLPSLERSNSVDNNKITFTLPKHTAIIAPFPAINVIVSVDAEFSSPVRSTESPSNPSSVQSLTLVENCSQTVHHINSNSLLSNDFTLTFELESLEPSVAHLCTYGWLSNSSKVEPHHIISSLVHIGFKDDLSQSDINNSNNNNNNNNNSNNNNTKSIVENSFSLIRDESEDLLTLSESFIYKIDISNKNPPPPTLSSSSNNNNNNNNVIIKYQNNQYPVTLQTPFLSTSTTLLHIFAALSKLKQCNNSNDSATDSTCINSLLNLVFTQGVYSNSNNENKTDNQLSQSLPSFKKDENSNKSNDVNNNNNNFKESGELLSNLISNLPKKPPGLQSLTAPPSMGKDLSNPIADFVAARAAGSSSTGPKKKGPPPRLGGPPGAGTVGASGNAVADIRLQRLASYNKVNQMWNLSLSDFAERHTISMRELEPYAFDFALDHIKNNWWKRLNRVATFPEIQWIRKCILDIINSPRINITFVDKLTSSNSTSSSNSGAVNDLGSLLNNSTTTTTTTTTTSTTNNDENNNKEVDPIKLKWIVEEVLNSEKLTFQTIGQTNVDSANEWFSIDVSETKGGRPHMEDKHVIIEYPQHLYNGNSSNNGNDNQEEQYFFGVFDGHNGKIAAEFTKVNLPFEIYSQTKGNPLSTTNETESLGIISKAYSATDKYFLEYAEREDKKAGTTVATVILAKDRFTVSNLGDTEVVVSRDGVASVLSTLHTPKNQSERDRIENAGGTIIHYGTLRVNGVLSVSRSIGDKNLKEYIIPDPDSVVVHIDKSTQFLIMATDGLWELFTHQEIVDYIITGKFKPQTIGTDNSGGALNTSCNNLENILESSSSSSSSTNPSIPTSTSQENLNSSSNSSITNINSVSGKIIEEALRRNPKDNITLIIIFFKNNFQP